MSTSLTAYPEFIEELDAFNRFSESYFDRGERSPVRRRDPDVERLMEGVAFFAAQTRIAAQRNVRSEFRNLFRSYLDYLMHPMPSMGLVRAAPRPELTEGTTIPAGTTLEITPESGSVGLFRTCAAADVFPLKRDGGYFLDEELVSADRPDFILQLRATQGRRVGSPAGISLFVNRVELAPSVALFDLLRQNLLKVSVCYDRTSDRQEGELCTVSFGRRTSASDRLSFDAGHPLDDVRRYFHFPQERLFLNLLLPPAPNAWSTFSLLFYLDPAWPPSERLTAENFDLDVVPVDNLHAASAAPIVHEGLQSSYPIVHPDPRFEFVLHSVKGVYEATSEGLVPISSRLVAPRHSRGTASSTSSSSSSTETIENTYALEESVTGPGDQRISLNMPGAFEDEKTVELDALWHQPGFMADTRDEPSVTAPGRDAGRVRWSLHQNLRPQAPSPLESDPYGLAHLLWLKMEPTLRREGLESLLAAIGTYERSVFRDLMAQVDSLKPTPVPVSGPSGTTVSYRYELVLKNEGNGVHPMAYSFSERVFDLISAWTSERLRELEVRCEGSRTWTLTQGSQGESS